MQKKSDIDDGFFVKISDSTELRRNLLESSRSIVKAMQGYEKVKDIRIKKIHAMIRLKEKMKEIGSLMNKLRIHLPKAHPSLIHVTRTRLKQSDTAQEEPRPQDLKELESELEVIEGKLSSLSL